jgi:hypothetical protein
MKTLSKATKAARHLFLLLLMHLCIASSATIYYVSSTTGNDANSGTSTNAPWKTLQKVNSSFRVLLPGDVILLKAGDKFEGPLKIVTAGLKLKPIRVGRYGSGANPIILGDHANAVWKAVAGHPGVFVANVYGGTVREVYGSDSSHFVLSKRGTLSLDRWLDTMSVNKWGFDIPSKTTYIKTAKGYLPPVIHLYEFTVVEGYKGYAIFENLDVRNGYNGISTGGTGAIVRKNSIRDMVCHGIYMPNAIAHEIASNTINRTAETSLLMSRAQGNWIHHNNFSNTLGTILGIPIRLGRDTTPERCGIGTFFGKNNLVERNTISNITLSFFDYWYESNTITRFNYCSNARAATTQGGSKLQLHGNIFNMNSGTGISASYEYDLKKNPLAEAGPLLIFNNVVRNFTGYGLYSATSSVTFRNNIITTHSSNGAFTSFASGTSSDYNCYHTTVALAKNGWNIGPIGNRAGYKTIESFRSATGQDVHSFVGDPKFVSTAPGGAMDFKLSSYSPCINKGQNLKSVGLVPQSYTDFGGVSIPQESHPDVGAFEYSGTSTNSNIIVSNFPFLGNGVPPAKNEPVTVFIR